MEESNKKNIITINMYKKRISGSNDNNISSTSNNNRYSNIKCSSENKEFSNFKL